ncbi:hypothetical protein ACIBCN_38455 [Nocardia sp. NPDC051052]|uniref:hypothetical protein n=1 Tax=Nocardia sp. NPDC051052 TaxID=3364322 RepID=UPI0037A869F4
MNGRENNPDGLRFPIDLDAFLAGADDAPELLDPEMMAAGERIADMLSERWKNAASATVTPIASGRARVMRVAGWTVQIRAAAIDNQRAVQQQADDELGIEFSRSSIHGEQTRVSVRSLGGKASPGDIVRVGIASGDDRIELLVVLYPDEEDTLAGQVVTRAVTMSEELEISVMTAAALESAHAAAITDAVRCSATAGRNAWRRIAKRLPTDDPVRVAVIKGLS